MSNQYFKLRLKETLGWIIRDKNGRFIKPISPLNQTKDEREQ